MKVCFREINMDQSMTEMGAKRRLRLGGRRPLVQTYDLSRARQRFG